MSEITNIVTQPRLRAALEQVRPQMEKLEPNDLVQLTVDPFTAISIARGAIPQIMKYEEQIVALPDFDAEHLNQLETYALAAHLSHTLLLAASAPPEHFATLVEESTKLREQLLNDAVALSRRDLINEGPLNALKGSTGYKHVASDLMTICNLFRAAWPKLVGKTCVTEAELERAEVLSDQLINDVGIREQSPAAVAGVALERQQSFTLFAKAYDQVRRAMVYLRWNEGDADEIAPSIYSGRSTSKKKVSSDLEKKPELVATTSPAATTPAAAVPAVPAMKPAIGLPGADPFAN